MIISSQRLKREQYSTSSFVCLFDAQSWASSFGRILRWFCAGFNCVKQNTHTREESVKPWTPHSTYVWRVCMQNNHKIVASWHIFILYVLRQLHFSTQNNPIHFATSDRHFSIESVGGIIIQQHDPLNKQIVMEPHRHQWLLLTGPYACTSTNSHANELVGVVAMPGTCRLPVLLKTSEIFWHRSFNAFSTMSNMYINTYKCIQKLLWKISSNECSCRLFKRNEMRATLPKHTHTHKHVTYLARKQNCSLLFLLFKVNVIPGG